MLIILALPLVGARKCAGNSSKLQEKYVSVVVSSAIVLGRLSSPYTGFTADFSRGEVPRLLALYGVSRRPGVRMVP